MDETPVPPATVTPGNQTSEFWLTKMVMGIGSAVTVVGAILGALQEMEVLKGQQWLSGAMVLIGILAVVVKALGYTAGRSTVKAADLASKGAVEVAALLPLLQQLVILGREARTAANLGAPALNLPGGVPIQTPKP